jgi:hypothetical protein
MAFGGGSELVCRWARVLTASRARADAAGLITFDVSVASSVARAHQHAAGAKKKGLCRLRSHDPRRRD